MLLWEALALTRELSTELDSQQHDEMIETSRLTGYKFPLPNQQDAEGTPHKTFPIEPA